MTRFIAEPFNVSVQNPRGICIYSEVGSGTTVGTYIFAYQFNFITNQVVTGEKSKFNVAGLEADAVFIAESELCLLTADNKLEKWSVNWTDTTTPYPMTKQDEIAVFASPTIQYPQVNSFVDINGDTIVVCWYRNSLNRAAKTSVKVLASSFEVGNENSGGTTTGAAGYRITKNYDGFSCYSQENTGSPGISFLKHTYNSTTNTLEIDGSFVNIGSGDCNGIEFLNLTGIGKILVWFCEAYIVNYPIAGFYNLDTASNFTQTIVSSAPASFGSIGIIQEDADVILAWQGPGDGRAVLCNIGDAVGNLNADRIIGIADDTKTIGGSVDVHLLGSVGQIPAPTLEPVGKCYVQLNGEVTQIPATGEVEIGLGLSSNELLLNTKPTTL